MTNDRGFAFAGEEAAGGRSGASAQWRVRLMGMQCRFGLNRPAGGAGAARPGEALLTASRLAASCHEISRFLA
jgi:hypothetical protein